MSAFILLLSGDVFTCMSLEDEFKQARYLAKGSLHVEDAREALIEHRSDIISIVCDIDFAYLAERDLFPAVPVVMLTSGDEESPNDLTRMMRKPTTPSEIVVTMLASLQKADSLMVQDEGKMVRAAA